MNKKIIAVFCVVILMVSVFSACGKKKLYTYEIDGIERAVVTNENNEFVTNEKGDIAFYVTESNGEILTNENGEPNINYAEMPKVFVYPNNVLSVEPFKIKVPDGWFAGDDGKIYKKDFDKKCYIKTIYVTTETEEVTFQSYLDQTIMSNREAIDAINKGSESAKEVGYASASYETEKLKYNDYDGYRVSYIIYNDKQEVVHYAENYYFVTADGVIYAMNYACEDGVGYDSNFNFAEWAQSNISFTEPVTETKA